MLLERARYEEVDDWTEAEAALAEAIEITDRGIGSPVGSRCLLCGVRILQGRLEEARGLLEQAREAAQPEPAPGDEVALLWAGARLAAAENNWGEALASFEAAANIVVRMGVRLDWARILLDWVEAHVSRGEPADLERARALLREALVVFEEAGAPLYVTLAEEGQRDLRAKTYAQALAQQKLTEELAVAGSVQEGFLPEEVPQFPGWQLAVAFEPARETSGDFYDLIPLPNGHLGIVVADVADKGAGAALYMALSRTLLRTYAGQHPTQPERVLGAVNDRILSDTHTDMFVTVFFGVLDLSEGTLIYSNAGHNPSYLFAAQEGREAPDPARELIRTGPPLGIVEEMTWEQGVVRMGSGDVLVLYTDGVTEAEDEQGGFFGSERLLEAVKANLPPPSAAQDVLDAVMAGVHEFVGQAPRFDDITLMVLGRDPKAEGADPGSISV
jgi:serine phosphatase RsbU (regulator of sigma subunit)